ncbi:MAG: DNA polymerase I [Ruminococcaceae bacterium]|nr:DNA polymerase I [Oscillospiraceae bacterium]
MEKLLIVDGNSIMNRAFYGVRPLITRTGIHTNAVYGYLNILKKHVDAIKPDYMAVAFDLKAPTFRHKLFEEYKAGRHATPEELLSQIPLIKEATALLGIRTLSVEGYEADDILGTLSNKFEGESYVVTGDRDSLQLVSDKTTVILASTGEDVVYDPEAIQEKYSLPPEKLIYVKALAGDKSDNIPGVAGIGEKTAIKLVLEGDSLEGIYEKLVDGSLNVSQGIKDKLIRDREQAFLSLTLAKINLEVPSLPDFSELVVGTQDTNALRELFIKLEFTKLMSRFSLDTVETKPAPKFADDGQISFDSIEEEKSKVIEVSGKEFIKLLPQGEVALDLIGDKFYYFKDKEIYSSNATKEVIKELDTSGRSLLLFDSKAFWHKAGEEVRDDLVAFDVQLASYIDNPDSRGDFSRIVMTYLKKSVSPLAESSPEERVPLILPLCEELKKKIIENNFEKLYFDVELPLSKVLACMEIRGFEVDKKGIEEYGKELKRDIEKAEENIFAIAKREFNINSPKQLGEVLFEDLKLPVIKKNKTGYSTDAETLEKLRFYSPIIDNILEYRHLSKLHGTYIEGLLKVVHEDNRIRTSFNQKQTQTGRLSSAEPNLQNIPVRTEQGSRLREFFTARQGHVLIDADYSQIELRVLAHMSGDKNLIDAFNSGADIHSITASQVFKVKLEEVNSTLRSRAKAVNFGIVYGMGEFSLAGDLHVSMKEAKDYINGYFATYPMVKNWLDSAVKEGYEKGYVTTLWGRRRYIPELTGTKKQLRSFGERVAKNSPIQGTAADLIKLAMVKTEKRLISEGLESRLILQVHDELIIEAPEKEADYVAKLLKEEMEGVAEMSVKLSVDVGIGTNWLSAKL